MTSSGQRRTSPRTRTLLEGSIVYNNGLSRMDCTIRDLSSTGARLVFAQPVRIPAEFELQIPRKRITRRAQIIWYDGRTHGIMFLDSGDKPTEGAPAHRQDGGRFPPLAQDAPGVSAILEEARRQIAELLDIPADAITLKVEVAR
ncbi:PilZ domain-containing protein [Microvirga sp. TS319]|uniref:PilZ domain-containing protein n=1 Tax=Microvirga sp. TS319 TaxID=3241165 RepID=UPI00351A69BB